MHLRSMFLILLIGYCQYAAIGQDSTAHATPTVYSTLTAKKYKLHLITGATLKAFSLDSLQGNSLYITGKNGPQQVSTDLIKELRIARKNNTALGMAVGAGIGAITGAIIGWSAYQEPEPDPLNLNKILDPGQGIYALAGGMVGMGIGLLPGAMVGASSGWQHYDFTAIPLPGRAVVMSQILSGK